MTEILLLEDDADMLELVTFLLEARKLKVTPVQDASLLFSAVKETQPKLIIMDIYLSGYDGRMLCRQIKTSSLYKDIPVILYSAGSITANSITESLADEFLPKPFDINSLYQLVSKYTEPFLQRAV